MWNYKFLKYNTVRFVSDLIILGLGEMKNTVFTPAEAERSLPLVKVIVRDILEVGVRLKKLHIDDPHQYEEIVELRLQLTRLLEEIEKLGCYFKDWTFEVGNVDFPSEIKGKTVHLCWKSDEDHVLYYHKISDPFEKRKPIPASLLTHLPAASTESI